MARRRPSASSSRRRSAARAPIPTAPARMRPGMRQGSHRVAPPTRNDSQLGVDCSCFVQNVYAAAGIRLPRVAVDQFNSAVPVTDPQPGDLVFFANTYQPGISHVGIYIGNGLHINAPTTGQFVSVASVFTGDWGAHYAGAHRPRA